MVCPIGGCRDADVPADRDGQNETLIVVRVLTDQVDTPGRLNPDRGPPAKMSRKPVIQ